MGLGLPTRAAITDEGSINQASTDAVASAAPIPATVAAPAVGLEANVTTVGKELDGALAVPDFGLAGWYGASARPGTDGSTAIAGHVDSFDGPDVFFDLGRLTVGDEILVTGSDGVVNHFVAESIEQADKTALPVDRIFAQSGPPLLALVTYRLRPIRQPFSCGQRSLNQPI